MKRSRLILFALLLLPSVQFAQDLDSLLVVARNIPDDSASITKMNIVGYYYLFRDKHKGHKILQEAKRKAIEKKNNYCYIESTNIEGIYHDLEGSKDSARYYFDKAFKMSRKGGFVNLEVRAINNLGMLNWNTGRFDEALNCFFEALKLNEKVPDTPAKAVNSSMYNNIGLIYQEMKLYEKALQYHKMAYDFRVKKERLGELPSSLNNIGICYNRLGKRDMAEVAYKEGMALAKQHSPSDYYKIIENFATLQIDKEDYAEAEKLLIEALDRPAEILFAEKAKMMIYAKLANIKVSLNRPEEAVIYGMEGLEILDREPSLKMYTQDLHLSLSRAYYMLGDHQKGHKHSVAFSEVVEEHFSSENASQIADMEVKYETEKKEKLIAEGRIRLMKAEAEAHISEMVIAENEAALLKSLAEGEKKEKLIAENRARLSKAEAEAERKEKLIAENKARLLLTEAGARKKNYMLVVSLFFIVFVSIIGYLLFRQQRLKNKQLEKEFELKSALAEIENQNRLQEQRLTISRDLHDNIGAQLTFIISSLDNLKYRLTNNVPVVTSKLEGISNFTQQTIIELRDTIWAMNTKHITFEDLRSRILNFVEKAQEANENIDFGFKIDPSLIDIGLTSVTGMNIYRTIQEAVNNAIKHSGATSVEIIVFDEQGMTGIIVRDNGKGFDRNAIQPGNGLQNMQKRIEGIGGSITIVSAPSEGTIITIHLNKQVQSA